MAMPFQATTSGRRATLSVMTPLLFRHYHHHHHRGKYVFIQLSKKSNNSLSAPFAVTTKRLHSTAANTSNSSSVSNNDDDHDTTKRRTVQVELQHVPSFPIVGSMITKLSGIPNTITTKSYDFWLELHRRHGDFFTIGIPSLGNPNCLYQTLHVVSDPREYVKVINKGVGGSYPSGLLENLWVHKKWLNKRQFTSRGLFENGPEWKRVRTFLQTDLLHPESARGYVPGMIETARLASKGAPAAAAANDLNAYLHRIAFDLFSSIMFGIMTETADPTTPTDPENEKFVKVVSQGATTSLQMLLDPIETIWNVLGLTSTKCQSSFDHFDIAWEIAQRKLDKFHQRKLNNQLTPNERNSYLARALERQQQQQKDEDEDPNNYVTVQDVHELCFTGLFASVDTTSAALGWNLFHIARSPNVQEKLYQELKQATGGGGRLTPEALSKQKVPYLYACIRETQRLSPPGAIGMTKRIETPIQLYGGTNHQLKKGDKVTFLRYPIGMDPNMLVGDGADDLMEFYPERWLPEAVEARKGTYREILDHPYLKDSFSQGARKCPGSRVAINEIQVMLSQFVLDWKISSPIITRMEDVTYQQKTGSEVQLPQLQFEARQ